MEIAFSTLACPGWGWEDITLTAKGLGYDGIELRGVGNEIYVPKAEPFLPENLDNTLHNLERLGLDIPCITSSCHLFDKLNITSFIDEGRKYIELAAKTGTPFIRVLGDENPEPGSCVDAGFVCENLSVLAEYAKPFNVTVLIETNGIFACSEEIIKCIERTGKSNVGILWDIHHPFRYFNEPYNETFAALKQYIKFIHVKDSIVEDNVLKYKMTGNGDIPVMNILELLEENHYEGYVSLEWVKRWHNDLEDPEVILPGFSNFMNMYKK